MGSSGKANEGYTSKKRITHSCNQQLSLYVSAAFKTVELQLIFK